VEDTRTRPHTGMFRIPGTTTFRFVRVLVYWNGLWQYLPMSTLAEIEAAVDALAPEQKQELLLFLAARLRRHGAKVPEPRKFSREKMEKWIARDEADMQRFREGK
jgi:hypothetical protein